jgi:hypothetical protein
VRSCKTHNNDYSDDENFVAYALLAKIENGPVAAPQWATKVMRAIAQNARVAERFRLAIEIFEIGGAIVPALKIDAAATARVMEKIARGLHYRLTGERLNAGSVLSVPLLHVATTADAADAAQTMIDALSGVTEWHSAGHADQSHSPTRPPHESSPNNLADSSSAMG